MIDLELWRNVAIAAGGFYLLVNSMDFIEKKLGIKRRGRKMGRNDLEKEFERLNYNGYPKYTEEQNRAMLAQVANLILNGQGIRGYWQKEYIEDETTVADPFDFIPLNVGHVGEYMKIELIGRINYYDPRNIPIELIPPFGDIKELQKRLDKIDVEADKKRKKKLKKKDSRIAYLEGAILEIKEQLEEMKLYDNTHKDKMLEIIRELEIKEGE
jgi:hypothetical protein